MTTIQINESTIAGKTFLEFAINLPFVKTIDNGLGKPVIKKKHFNATTENAIKDLKNGKATRVSLDNFRKQLYGI